MPEQTAVREQGISIRATIRAGHQADHAERAEAEPHLATQFGIRSIPTLALFQGGREIARQAGVMGAQDIVRWTSTQVGR